MSIQLTVMSLDAGSFEQPSQLVYHRDDITFGRMPSNDVVLDRPEVAAFHARLRLKPNRHTGEPTFYVTDLGSRFGTRVENSLLEPDVEFELLPNQRIVIGGFLIKPTLSGAGLQIEKETTKDEAYNPLTSSNGNGYHSENGYTNGFNKHLESSEEDAATEEFEESEEQSPEVFGSLDSPVLNVRVDGKNVSNLDFFAVQLFGIYGQVFHKGHGLEGVEIDGGELGQTVTGIDGRFYFASVSEGTAYRVTARKQGFLLDQSEFMGRIEGDLKLSLHARKLLVIKGRVTHKGKPLTGVEIDAGELGRAITDSLGVYTFENVPEGGVYSFTPLKSGYMFSKDSSA